MKTYAPSTIVALALYLLAPSTFAQSAAFNYQGQLTANGIAASGSYDLVFTLHDAVAGGNQIDTAITNSAVPVVNGVFRVELDFGAGPFAGQRRWLQIQVATNGVSSLVALTPRQELNAVPYSTFATKAGGVSSAAIATEQLADNAVTTGKIHPGEVVKSLNNLKDDVSLVAGPNITLTPVGNNGLQIAAPAGGLALPYAGTASSAGPVFTLANSGSGAAGAFLGNVGIGTTSPSATLDVRNSEGSAIIRAKAVSGGGGVVLLDRAATARSYSSQISFLSAGTSDFAMGTSQGSAGDSDFSIYDYGIANNVLTILKANGNVGIGLNNPQAPLHVVGASGNSVTLGAPEASLHGQADASALGIGILGDSANGEGVVGTATHGNGVRGTSNDRPGVFGSSDTDVGVRGHSAGPNGFGVLGYATATSGFNRGVYGQANSKDGIGVDAYNSSGIAIRAASAGRYASVGPTLDVKNSYGDHGDGTTGVAARFESTYGSGLIAIGAGIYAGGEFWNLEQNGTAIVAHAKHNDANNDYEGDALHALGNVRIDGDVAIESALLPSVGRTLTVANIRCGTLVAGGKLFQIDHPLNPGAKVLRHACIESSEMKNLYDGTVTTDDQGEATIELAAWFEALNENFRYQLTCIGEFAQAIVVEEIHNNRFTIKTDKPQVKVSWQVTGNRHDTFAVAHPLIVEQSKRGTAAVGSTP